MKQIKFIIAISAKYVMLDHQLVRKGIKTNHLKMDEKFKIGKCEKA